MITVWHIRPLLAPVWGGIIAGTLLASVGNAHAQSKPNAKTACVKAYTEGQVHRKNGELLLARDDFKVCAEKVCPIVLRKDCGPWLQKVEESIPSIVVAASSSTGKPLAESQISVDGKVPEKVGKDDQIEIDPGAHVVRVEAAGHEPVERSIKVRSGEKKVMLDIKLAPKKPRETNVARPIPGSTIAFAVVSLAGFGAFTGFGLHGNGLKKDLEECKPACAPARVDEVKRDYIIADASLGVGVIFLGLATWSFATRPEVHRPAVTWHVNVLPGQTSLGLSGVF